MKKVKCKYCNDEREVEDNIIMAICNCCQCEMEEIKYGGRKDKNTRTI